MMTLVFWQNIISQVQLPYILELNLISDDNNVILIVEKELSTSRISLGWKSLLPTVEKSGIQIYINPTDNEIKKIVKENTENSHHFFSGLRAVPMVFRAFKESIKYDVCRYLIVEGPSYYKHRKEMHYLKTLLTEYKYFKYITKIYAIGSHALDWYPKWGFKQNQIIPFTYVVNTAEFAAKPIDNQYLKLLYIGSLIHLKGVDYLLNALSKINDGVILDIIGNGKQRTILEKSIKTGGFSDKVRFLGHMSSSKIRDVYKNYDVHVLPSRYDGWGAVVNEALMSGLFVLCSDQCGAKELIQDKANGIVFSNKKSLDLFNALNYCIENKKSIRAKKGEIKSWSQCIEPKTVANYFLTSLISNETILPPWKKKKLSLM